MKSFAVTLALLGTATAPAQPPAREHKVRLVGRWQVGDILDRSHRPLPADLAKQLHDAHLPKPGEVVRMVSGRLCAGSVPCDDVSWYRTTVGAYEGGPRLMTDFGVPAQTALYVGRTSDKYVAYAVIERPDHSLGVRLYICDDTLADVGCRNTLEPWHPASPDAAMVTDASRR